MSDRPSVELSVIIVSHGHAEMTRRCIASLGPALEDLRAETIVVDNLAEPDFATRIGLADAPNPMLLTNDEPLGFGANVNRAAAAASGRVLLILNPDTEYRSGSLGDAIRVLDDIPDAGIVAARLLNADGTPQINYRRFPSLIIILLRILRVDRWPWRPRFYRRSVMTEVDLNAPSAVDWVFGSFMMIHRETYSEYGGFDENYFMYYEDVDICFRLRSAGYRCYVVPFLLFDHLHLRTSSKKLLSKLALRHFTSALRYVAKCNALLSPPRFN